MHYLVKQGNNVRLTDRSPVQSKHAENCLILVPSLSVGAFLIITVIIYFFALQRGSCHHVKAQSVGNL